MVIRREPLFIPTDEFLSALIKTSASGGFKIFMRKYLKYFFIFLGLISLLLLINAYQRQSGTVLGIFSHSASTNLRIIFLNVGQGDSALVIAPGGDDILIDGGPDKTVVQKLGQYLPYSDREIEYMVLSHPHSDHVSGLVEVLKRYKVDRVIMTGASHTATDYLEFLQLIKEKNIPITLIDQPQHLILNDLDFEFLEPDKSLNGIKVENLNNSSLVFKVVYGSSTALFMGDFENEEELASSSVGLKSDLLKVGHHGSQNANSKNFLSLVSPQFAVISAGKSNSYGLPDYRTVYYLKQLDALVFRTDENGDIEFLTNGKSWQLAN
jgi:competence protein ComEC